MLLGATMVTQYSYRWKGGYAECDRSWIEIAPRTRAEETQHWGYSFDNSNAPTVDELKKGNNYEALKSLLLLAQEEKTKE
jgi:hypothetical protein